MEPEDRNPITAIQGNDPGTPRPPEPKEGVPGYVLADPAAQIEPDPPRTGITLKQYAILVAAGAFATTFAQSKVLALYPTTFLLKDHLHLRREDVAVFFFWATFAWNLKPLSGILTDAFPLFGTRRRSYMILGSVAAGILWLLMALFPNRYTMLLLVTAGMNVATVFASTVMGGLMVEAGQAFSSPGRISSLRQVVQSVAGIGAPLLGGWLAARKWGWNATAVLGGATVFGLAAVAFIVLKERRIPPPAPLPPGDIEHHRVPPGAIIGLCVALLPAGYLTWLADTRNMGISTLALLALFGLMLAFIPIPSRNPVIYKAQGQLVQLLESRTLWMAVIMLFLVYTVPGLGTALTYRQEDVLHFKKEFIGLLSSFEGIAGVIGAVGYAVVCRKFNLRTMLTSAIVVNGLATLLYLIYYRQTAYLIHPLGGFLGVLSELALMDLAVRSTPRGCEGLGFALMMSVRNFGIGISDVIGTKLMDQAHWSFNTLVLVNAATTLLVLAFIPFLPRVIMSRKEGETAGPTPPAAPASSQPAGARA